MNILDITGKEMLFFDGGMGTLLQKRGLCPGELPEMWNIEKSNEIIEIHLEYLNAGANIITSNTFGANLLKFPKDGKTSLDDVVGAAICNAKKAIEKCGDKKDKFVALDIGPCGRLLKPLGDMEFEDAVSLFAETVKAGARAGADLILIETMNDLYETKAAVLAAKENSNLPIFVTNAYGTDEKLMTGASPEAVCATLEGLGVNAIGLNCSFGPGQMLPVVKRLCEVSSLPIIVNPNAGLPAFKDGKTTYDITPDEFADIMTEIAKCGAHILGGCCGTTPEYIEKTVKKLTDFKPKPVTEKNISVISSYTHAVCFGNEPIIIGERINPTGKKLFKEALRNHDIDYILNVGLKQEEAGAHVLDVNVGLPEIDEVETIAEVVQKLQAVTSLPLQIDTSNPQAMEKALRLYNGKPMVNSVNGKKESMEAVFPLVKKYGGLVVALTLDEDGIPESAAGRCAIAEKIYAKAAEYGIKKKDIITDTLAMTISTDSSAAKETLTALETISNVGGLTSLGVSNISFGLPSREFINASFFTMALTKGLSAAIINPHSVEMMKAYKSFMALSGFDKNCESYIEFASTVSASQTLETPKSANATADDNTLKSAIIKGLSESAHAIAVQMLETTDAFDVINTEIVPALDIVGKGFEEKKVYLPQLLISAEAAKAAFDAVKEKMSKSGNNQTKKCTFVLATVHGDIHDIGKNIVKALLENYGFNVVDLGKDVAPEKVCETALKLNAPLVGLSALMTTTVPAMEETVKLIKKALPDTKVVVGGAVLTEEYANAMGADKYCSDAMETVRYAEEVNSTL
ncbi:MAG: homocysteine S-methyltransferase family protein [Clostridia bacterium]|nr:homocysteine S-methyltransferase family protein [Clostridia bacterium]